VSSCLRCTDSWTVRASGLRTSVVLRASRVAAQLWRRFCTLFTYLTEVAHDTEVLDVQIIAPIGAHHLGALARQRLDKVAAQETRGPKNGGRDAADLRKVRSQGRELDVRQATPACQVYCVWKTVADVAAYRGAAARPGLQTGIGELRANVRHLAVRARSILLAVACHRRCCTGKFTKSASPRSVRMTCPRAAFDMRVHSTARKLSIRIDSK